ncbi:MAG: PSP1 domain-containing protein [candidate division WOR-3 bacterium]|jgi:cell fate regulator YaaT (PSP1 superfamily)
MERVNNHSDVSVPTVENRQRQVLVQFNLFKTNWCTVPAESGYQPGDAVIVADEEGEDLGEIVAVAAGALHPTEGTVVRYATAEDLRLKSELANKAKQALELFRRLRAEYNLPMQVVGAHWRLDRKKVCFYFIADEKLNFRPLHKAIASALNTRVAIKQIGVRDHTRLIGGLGICGRVVCCKQFLKELKPITLRMARQQHLFVEPNKISGLCGKLLCCLGYEEEVYQHLIAMCPQVGARVMVGGSEGTVIEVNALTRRLKVRFGDGSEQTVALEDIEIEHGHYQ